MRSDPSVERKSRENQRRSKQAEARRRKDERRKQKRQGEIAKLARDLGDYIHGSEQ